MARGSQKLLTPPEFDGFSYRDYLARSGIHAMVPNAEVEIDAYPLSAAFFMKMHTDIAGDHQVAHEDVA